MRIALAAVVLVLALTVWLLNSSEKSSSPTTPETVPPAASGSVSLSSSATPPGDAGLEADRNETVGRSDDGDATTSASGRVVGADGLGVVDVRVELSCAGRLLQATTADAGRYFIDGLSVGNWEVRVHRERWISADFGTWSCRGAGQHVLPDLVLGRHAGIEGRVEGPTGNALAGAAIVVMPVDAHRDPDEVARTAGDGSFRVYGMPPGPWTVAVLRDGFEPGIFRGSCPRQGVVRLDPWILRPTLEVQGVVLDCARAKLAELTVQVAVASSASHVERDVLVHLAGLWSTPMDSSARFTLGRLPVDVPVYVSLVDRSLGDVSCAEPVQVRAGDQGVEIRYLPGGELSVIARDVRDGHLVDDFELLLRDASDVPLGRRPGVTRRIGPDGSVQYKGIRAATGLVMGTPFSPWLHAKGYRPVEIPGVTLFAGRETRVGPFSLQRGPTLHVQVVDADGSPVARAEVRLSIDREAAKQVRPTDAEGRSWFARGSWEAASLSVAHPEFCDYSAEISGPQDCDLTHVAALGTGGALHVWVRNPNGGPVAGQGVRMRRDDQQPGPSAAASTDLAGLAVFGSLLPGLAEVELETDSRMTRNMVVGNAPVSIVVSDDPDDRATQTVEIEEGRIHELQFEVPLRIHVGGRVSENGRHKAGAQVKFVPGRDLEQLRSMGDVDGYRTTSDVDGSYLLEQIPAGEYIVAVTHADWTLASQEIVSLQETRLDLNFDWRFQVLRGTVQTTAGDPVAGARVSVEHFSQSHYSGPKIMTMDEAGIVTISDARPAAASVVTDAKGAYSIPRLPAQKLRVVVRAPLVLEETRTIELSGRADTTQDFILDLAGAVLIRPRKPDGSHRYNCQITATRQGGSEPITVSEFSSGKSEILLGGLAAGTWDVAVQPLAMAAGSEESWSRTVEVVAGARQELDAVLQ